MATLRRLTILEWELVDFLEAQQCLTAKYERTSRLATPKKSRNQSQYEAIKNDFQNRHNSELCRKLCIFSIQIKKKKKSKIQNSLKNIALTLYERQKLKGQEIEARETSGFLSLCKCLGISKKHDRDFIFHECFQMANLNKTHFSEHCEKSKLR
jgi:hypothetical protein